MFDWVRNIVEKQLNKRRMEQRGLVGSRKRRTDRPLFEAAEHSKVLGLFMLALLWAVCSLMLTLPSLRPVNAPLVLLQRAPKTVFADFDFVYTDNEKTGQLREEARNAVPLYFRISGDSFDRSQKLLEDFFAAVAARSSAPDNRKPLPDKNFAALLETLEADSLNLVYQLIQNKTARKQFAAELHTVLNAGVFGKGVKDNYKVGQQVRIIDSANRDRLPKAALQIPDSPEAAREIVKIVLKYYSPGKARDTLQKILVDAFEIIIGTEGNLRLAPEIIAAKQQEAEKNVRPVKIEVKKYDVIIAMNQEITQKDLDRSAAYDYEYQNRLKETDSVKRIIRNVTWSFILMLFVGFYMYHIHPEVVKSNQRLALTGTIVVISLLMNYLFIKLFYFLSSIFTISPVLITAAVPLALAAILLSVMIGFRVALYVGFFVSAITSMMLSNSFDTALQGIVISCLAAIVVRRSTHYRVFFIRSFLIVFFLFWLLDFGELWHLNSSPEMFAWAIGMFFFNAFVTATSALILVFIFELLFGVTTDMALFTLCDYNHPLLRRLELEAPGTFYHSLMVASLAEYAAKAIKANPIKARVGAIFHDIGKLAKPEYFIENTSESEDKHADLHPRMSSLIILNHVKEGLDLALKYKLRKVIRDAIQQHHGTDIVYYFYKRALDENREKGLPVDDSEYRYQGPLPVEKEIVIISLADACEAAARAMVKPTPNKIEAMVGEIIRKRLRDGQLDHAALTIAELTKIKDSFTKTLTTMSHSRIAYPQSEVEDEDDLFVAAQRQAAAAAPAAESDAAPGGSTGAAAG
ncbi:MAG: HDIG domain-containing protein [Victivallaceae bacterium]|nr:HDIG domain-containing protein [Victivallaceae bacterium]